jgi:hypothetical protein
MKRTSGLTGIGHVVNLLELTANVVNAICCTLYLLMASIVEGTNKLNMT